MSKRRNRRATRRPLRGGKTVLLAAILCLGAPPASAQQEADLERLARDYPADAVRGVEDVLDRAGELGVPRRALVDKALEGAAKRVPGDRLVQALERRLEGLRTAATSLPAGAGEASLRAGADALGQGVRPGDLRRLGEVASEGERPAALVVLGELTRLGVPVDEALTTVERAMERGQGGPAMMALGQRVRDAVRAGRSPLEALARAGVGPFGPGFPGRGPPGGFPGGSPPGHAGPPVPPGAGLPGDFPGPGDGPSGDGPPVGGPPDDPPAAPPGG